MTVYSGVITGQSFEKSGVKVAGIGGTITRPGKFSKLNLALAIGALSFVVSYIFISNFVVSQRYALDAAKLELGGVSADLAVEKDGKATEPAITKVLDYAQNSGMIEAKASDSIVEDSGFAISNPNVQ